MSISISAIETREPGPTVRAINSTLACTPADKVYWVSTYAPPKEIQAPTVWLRTRAATPQSLNYWLSEITLRLLPAAVNEDHNIIVQSDGFAVNKSAWTDQFLDYDYIGAPWLWWKPHEQVGNGGFSLRSRRFYDALVDWRPGYTAEDWPIWFRLHDPMQHRQGFNEDNLIASPFRPHLEQHYGIKYAPVDLAHQWSIEASESYSNPWFKRSLGFHGVETAPHYGIQL